MGRGWGGRSREQNGENLTHGHGCAAGRCPQWDPNEKIKRNRIKPANSISYTSRLKPPCLSKLLKNQWKRDKGANPWVGTGGQGTSEGPARDQPVASR